MYSLIRALPARRLATEQLPALATAFVVAEVFYKFGSFALECAAFLVTWFAFDMAVQGIVHITKAKK